MDERLSESDKQEIEGLYPSYTMDGKITFSGAVIKYYDDDPPGGRRISWNWNSPRTYKDNISDFKNVVLKAVHFCVGDGSLDSFTDETFAGIEAQVLELKPKIKKDRLRHYLQLAAKTYLAAASGERGFNRRAYPEKLLDERDEAITTRKERLLIRKSFGVDEEIKLLRWIASLDPETASGSDIGLMLMFLFGLRNGEACGLRFGDIHTLENGHEAFFITYSVKAGTNRIQLGGKTRNAFRAIPLYPFVKSFLRKRRAWARGELKKNKSEDGADADMEDADMRSMVNIRIASGRTITENLTAADLTNAGKRLFKDVLGIDSGTSRRLKALSDDFKSKLQQAGIDEKDETTYLFRRNFATHLANLGLNSTQIQYLIGHDIESEDGYQRNYFSTGDELDELCQIMDRHPFQFIMENIGFNDGKRRHSVSRRMSLKHPGNMVRFRIMASETFDSISTEWPEDKWVEAGLQGFSIPMIGEIGEVVDTVTGEYAVYFDHMVALAEKEKETGADETACADPSEDAGEETGEGS